MSERLLTVAETADALRMNTQTIRKWLRSGRLRGLRMGEAKLGRVEWRVPESAVSEVLKPQSATRLQPMMVADSSAPENEGLPTR